MASALGRLAGEFNFENGYRLVTAVSSAVQPEVNRLNTPTRTELRAEIQQSRPSIIHLSGVDAHQAATFASLPAEATPRADAFLLADETGQPDAVPAVPLDQVLTANGAHWPDLVAFNCYYSDARLAPMAVAAGTHLAIGFQDTIDDTIAERFFQGAEAFREIAGAVNASGLVPVETLQLTKRGAFSQALELGIKNLTTPWSFDALVDIQIAREGGVTPLPLFQNQL